MGSKTCVRNPKGGVQCGKEMAVTQPNFDVLRRFCVVSLGNLKIKQSQSPSHSAAHSEFGRQLGQMNVANNNIWTIRDTRDVFFGVNLKKPDKLMLLDHHTRVPPRTARDLVLVLEVGYRESFPHMWNKIASYFGGNSDVQLVILIKIYRRDFGPEPMIAALFDRTTANPFRAQQLISFGTLAPHFSVVDDMNNNYAAPGQALVGVGCGGPPCLGGAGAHPMYQLRIPRAPLLVHAPAAVAAAVPVGHANYNIDLHRIQQAVTARR